MIRIPKSLVPGSPHGSLLLLTALGFPGLPSPRQAPKPPPRPRGKVSWKVPAPAFVEFRKERRKFSFEGDRRILYLGADPAPGFYGHELSKDGTIRFKDAAIPDLIPQIGLSLFPALPKPGKKRKRRLLFPLIQKCGSVEARGTLTDLGPGTKGEVRQNGEFRIQTIKSLLPKEDRRGRRESSWKGIYDLDASLTYDRVLDPRNSRILSLEASLRGVLLERRGKERRWPFEIEESWTFVTVLEPDHPGFRKRVRKAIDRGSRYLGEKIRTWRTQRLFEDSETKIPSRMRSYGTGRLALILLALLKRNPYRERAPIPALLAELRKREPWDSYALGISLMALEALYEPPNEGEQIRQGLLDGPTRRKPSKEDLDLMRTWTERLLGNLDTRIDQGYRFRFNYRPGPRYDNSVTQYAALGFWSAELCGVTLPRGLWPGLLDHFLRDQGPREGNRPIRLSILRYGEDRGGTRGALKAWRRGFSYRGDEEFPTGSMTTAGITGLLLCRAALARAKRNLRKADSEAARALREAFAWLGAELRVRGNPRNGRNWHFYYLYGLERACELAGVRRLQGRDWYFEGAMQLLPTQGEDGGWGSLEDTCFALLFLKRSVATVLTRK